MRRSLTTTLLLGALAFPALSQPAETPPKFPAADVRVSPKSDVPLYFRGATTHAGRYELKTATMVDLIRTAYGLDPDKILGGPNWLELDRFDVVGKLPDGTTPDTQKSMLQTLLAERFHLAVHKDTRPLPAYALIAGRKILMKDAASSDEPPACTVDADSPVEGGTTIKIGGAVAASMGVPATLHLGPGGTLHYICRNMTMAAFAERLHGMMGAGLGANPVVDATGLAGKWNFDIRWSVLSLPGADTNRVTVFDAVEKQLGLKLEERPVPTPVLVVDRVDRQPISNPAGTADLLPVIPPPTEFEVASVKPIEPGAARRGGFQFQPGGRMTVQGMPMRLLLSMAFDTATNDQLVGLPDWVDSGGYDIAAKAAVADPSARGMDNALLAPMMRSLLAERFKMTYHTEQRDVAAYSLVSAKPKLKKADPASRISCKFPPPPPGAPGGTRVLACQNVTIAQFAERLYRLSTELSLPVLDATGLDGTWDLTLIFNANAGLPSMGGGRGAAEAGPGAGPAASDPSGSLTLFEAIEKQLGLKLEKQKRPIQVYVIDRLEQKPTEN